MHFLAIVPAFVLYFFLLLATIGFYEADVALARQKRECPDQGKEDPWAMTIASALATLTIPVLPLVFLEGFRNWDRLLSWEVWSIWTAFNIVLFMVVLRCIYRPISQELDARRAAGK